MNKINYDNEMMKIIGEEKGERKLLLHSCCAPCSSTCIERLKPHFSLSVYYYNPNIDGVIEFKKRALEQKRLCNAFGVNYIEEKFDSNEFFAIAKGLENAPEGSDRCFKCFYLRLKKTAQYAKENGYDCFATTLTLSPLKNADKINEIGFLIEGEIGVKYLPSDFKKRGGYLRSIELSKEYELYRQNYCGCVFSKKGKN